MFYVPRLRKMPVSGAVRPCPSPLGESMETVTAAVESIQAALESRFGRADLLAGLLPGAARNAIDCALWDGSRKAKPTLPSGPIDLKPITTAFTIVIDDADKMAAQAERRKPIRYEINLSGRRVMATYPPAACRSAPRCAAYR